MFFKGLSCIFDKTKPRKWAKSTKIGVSFFQTMTKIHKISQFQHSFQFFNAEEHFNVIYQDFLESNLGKIHEAIPWHCLDQTFKIKENTKGPACIFSPKGKIALMFLKNYSCSSDERLIEQLNSNVHYQLFCDLLLQPGQKLKSFKIASQIRCELAKGLDIKASQKQLAKMWLPYMRDIDKATTDATCYESLVRYPTNQKLLWESVEWSYHQMKLICKHLKIKSPRTKFNKWKSRYYDYSRKRRKPQKDKRVLTRALLHLLDKLIEELAKIETHQDFNMPPKYFARILIIKKVLEQQSVLFTTGENPTNRIVSLAKDYIRPIVRGKEVKPVEFGAKVNKVQIDGINFIEHVDFNAFNEGTRFISTVQLAQELTHTKLNIMGADAIYATNKNRTYATSKQIKTDFTRKGRAGKHEDERKILAKMITKERASRLEGSFGKEKEHYHLKRVRARTKKNEILWIFCGIHVANALEIGRRKAANQNNKQVA